VLTFFAIGLAIGAATGIPIGPVNAAVIDAAYRHTLRRAMAVAMGGAFADGLYSTLGVLGVTPMLRANPMVPNILYLVSGAVLIVYGLLTARSRPVSATRAQPKAPTPSREMWSGFTIGLLLIALNPAALVTWVVILGSFLPPGATQAEGLVTAVGVTIGSFAWFALVAWLTHRGKHRLGEKAVWIPRVIGIALSFYGAYMLYKGARYFLA
jgi:threonine/homoserine/homoserine lactone efflux protein